MSYSAAPPCQEVWAGRSRLGSIEPSAGHFIARAADGREIGNYDTAVAATRAVCDEDQRRREIAA